jgi:hypothetical protein
MSEEVLQERQLSIEEYLTLFSEASVDYSLVKARSDKLQAIHLKTLRSADGQLYEDTTFVEKTGVTYTIRVKL